MKKVKGKNNPCYGKKRKGVINRAGYTYLYLPSHPKCTKEGYIAEHRLVVEKKIGRFLRKKEVVHHLNEIKSENNIDNLMLFESTHKHLSFHTKIKQFGITNTITRQIKSRWDEFK